MQSKIELQNEIESQIIVKPVSHYKNYAISPTGTNITELNTTSNPQITFEFPADSILNFSRVHLTFNRTNTSGNTVASNYLYIPTNYFPFISRIELYTSGGNLKLVDLPQADVYSKSSAYMNNNFLKNFGKVSSILYPKQNYGGNLINDLPNSSANGDGNSVVEFDSYEWSDGAEFGARAYNVRLGDAFPDTIFNLNKSIYVAKSVFLRITFNNINKIVGTCVKASTVPVAFSNTSKMAVSNFQLKIYSENDPLIIEQLKNQSRQGVSYVMPDIVSNVINTQGSGVKGFQMKVSNMTGNNDSRLYKCYSILNATGNNAYIPYLILPTSNYNNEKYNYLSLFVNSFNILNLDTTMADDLQHLVLQNADHSITDLTYIKDIGSICNVFDTSPAKKEYNQDELKGLLFGPSGDITINWQYTIPTGVDDVISGGTNPSYENYQHAVILRKLYAKDGQLSTVPFN